MKICISFKVVLLMKMLIINVDSNGQIYDMMTEEEFSRVFRAERDQVSNYEFIKINLLPTTKINRRLSSQNRVLSFVAFGRSYDIQLKKRDNILIGKDTPIWHVKTSSRNSSLIQYTSLTNVFDNIHGIYQDSQNMVSLVEYKFEEHPDLYYDGMIDTDLAISPLPQRLINEISKMYNQSNVEDHVIFKISSQNSTFQYQSLDDTIGHSQKYMKKRKRKLPLKVFYPEILVVLDASIYKHLGQEPHLAMNYLVPFWNGVDLRYNILKFPEVKLNIAGVILAQDETALKFIHNNLDDSGRIQAKKALVDAGVYFDSEAKFITSKDMVVIMTKRDICSLKTTNYCKSSALGKAFTGKVCSKRKNTAIFEDNGGYAGIITATHEIGHLLGLPHDGEDDAIDCSMKDGYIMASAKFRSVNSLCWSQCSKKLLEEFASLTVSNCLENKPKNIGDTLIHVLPGKFLTLEEQCLARGGKPCIFNETVCWKLHCTKSMTNMKCVGKAPAAEGSACGEGLHCLNGACVAEFV